MSPTGYLIQTNGTLTETSDIAEQETGKKHTQPWINNTLLIIDQYNTRSKKVSPTTPGANLQPKEESYSCPTSKLFHDILKLLRISPHINKENTPILTLKGNLFITLLSHLTNNHFPLPFTNSLCT